MRPFLRFLGRKLECHLLVTPGVLKGLVGLIKYTKLWGGEMLLY